MSFAQYVFSPKYVFCIHSTNISTWLVLGAGNIEVNKAYIRIYNVSIRTWQETISGNKTMCKQIGIIQINVSRPQNVCFPKKMIGERVRKINMYNLFAFLVQIFP